MAHFGFIVTNPYQLFHYGPIRRHLSGNISVYVDVRDDDFGLARELLESHMGPCRIQWVNTEDLGIIDGKCDVIICQTPVPVLKFFTKSLVVAQQYSLAKEQYQYGVWRSHADLNLMYGDYSVAMTSAYSHAVAVGNPLFDEFAPAEGLLDLRPAENLRLRVLYMPTYGDLSDRESVLSALLKQDVDLSIKAHHADFEIAEIAERHGIHVFLSDAHPIGLIRSHDLVVSDYSGAIYDALAMRAPVALIEAFNSVSASAVRLSDEDRSRTGVASLAQRWTPGDSLRRAYEQSRTKLADDAAYRAFLDRFYVNFGAAADACAEQISTLATEGSRPEFATTQVRETTRRYITTNRTLRTRITKLERDLARAKAKAGKSRRSRLKAHVSSTVRMLPGGTRLVQNLKASRGRFTSSGREREACESDELPGIADSSGFSPVAHMRRHQTMELVHEALSSAGVDHRTSSSDAWSYIAIRERDLDLLHRALQSLEPVGGERVRLWMGAGAKYSIEKDISAVTLGDLAASESIVVAVPLKSGYYSVQRSGGVEILILEHRENRLVSRRARAEKPDWTTDFEIDSGAVPAPGSRGTPSYVSEANTADIVFTWVDSFDPAWAASRAEWSGQHEIVMASAANDERYLDREELRYSLRSIAMYAPFIRNIYVVTQGHRPSWLVDDNDRIRVVPHTEIFPDVSVLPTFNSHAIEACLHRIPGLAENFIYFNDDVFLGRETQYSDFYTQAGLIKSRFSPSSFVAESEPSVDAIPTDWASYNAVKLMRDEFGMSFARKHKHVPHPMKRSLLDDMERKFPEVFEKTRSSRFRDHHDYAIPSMLAHYYGIATREAVDWANIPGEYAYADTGRHDFQSKLNQIIAREPLFFCLNVTLHDDIGVDAQAEMLVEFLDARFPFPSPFER